ncbi:hypothetical protein ACTFIY_001633 [Dictyostelium cf. discoideum]
MVRIIITTTTTEESDNNCKFDNLLAVDYSIVTITPIGSIHTQCTGNVDTNGGGDGWESLFNNNNHTCRCNTFSSIMGEASCPTPPPPQLPPSTNVPASLISPSRGGALSYSFITIAQFNFIHFNCLLDSSKTDKG